MAHSQHITKYQARKLIRLAGTQSTGYLVLTGGVFDTVPIAAPTRAVACAILRALRELAAASPAGVFPRSGRKR